jgi:hypothetical protein
MKVWIILAERSTARHRCVTDQVLLVVVTAHSFQLRTSFNWFSLLATAASLMEIWESFCATMISGLVSGGPVSLVYGYLGAASPGVHSSMLKSAQSPLPVLFVEPNGSDRRNIEV